MEYNQVNKSIKVLSLEKCFSVAKCAINTQSKIYDGAYLRK